MTSNGDLPAAQADNGGTCEHDYEWTLIAVNASASGTIAQLTPVYECRKCGKRLTPVEYRMQQNTTGSA